jgi:predicted DNA-binding transcriptional regulator AlpA
MSQMSVAEKLQDRLAYPPKGMRADRAAAYLGMSKSEFLRLVEEGVFPKAKKIGTMAIWDRCALDVAFEVIAAVGDDERNSWDRVLDRT